MALSKFWGYIYYEMSYKTWGESPFTLMWMSSSKMSITGGGNFFGGSISVTESELSSEYTTTVFLSIYNRICIAIKQAHYVVVAFICVQHCNMAVVHQWRVAQLRISQRLRIPSKRTEDRKKRVERSHYLPKTEISSRTSRCQIHVHWLFL